ncbi:hypothetical protein FRB94_005373 [Tulasnella sp. JGI-2019a]|nr:hypothetical protein FRB94_005373 [Tulasnella sp. JGI-2019a]KAG9004478.1 hypothetical protein FRB93_010255 [Tulasnella sp. JGI-2019a]KAG9027949.1 hypothetical protein FRB95_007026 [Tulasnella sp. JGI-2019a]
MNPSAKSFTPKTSRVKRTVIAHQDSSAIVVALTVAVALISIAFFDDSTTIAFFTFQLTVAMKNFLCSRSGDDSCAHVYEIAYLLLFVDLLDVRTTNIRTF